MKKGKFSAVRSRQSILFVFIFPHTIADSENTKYERIATNAAPAATITAITTDVTHTVTATAAKDIPKHHNCYYYYYYYFKKSLHLQLMYYLIYSEIAKFQLRTKYYEHYRNLYCPSKGLYTFFSVRASAPDIGFIDKIMTSKV